ncbi:MAG: ABC transporter ATP-binding protein, partial [Sutterellaceae bacterium]|nr:ABC transporter ATP-binding protein [Sutterellaceae bacterium]
NLDAKLRLHMRTEIRRIQQELEITCLYVTHDQKEALTMSDRIMVMNHGHIEQIGTPMHLYEDPATPFVADFIGQANLIRGKLAREEAGYGDFTVEGRTVRARMGRQNPPKVGEDALLVIRPENLRIAAEGDANRVPVTVVNRLFEGDRISYEVVLPGHEKEKPIEMSVPFLPGTGLIETGTGLEASFIPEAGVIIRP